MKVKSLVWMGIKTDSFQKMEQFLQEVMGLQPTHHAHDFVVFQLPNKAEPRHLERKASTALID